MTVRMVLNGAAATLPTTPSTSLLRALRAAGYTGTTGACEQGECGSCTVQLDDRLVCSCLVPALACEGRTVATIERGVAADLAAALARHGAVQCGFCTPGVVMAASALLDDPAPLERGRVVEGIAGNLCRCTGYLGIVDAVLDVDRARRQGR